MYNVIIELANGVVFSTKVLKSEWNKFYEWLENDNTIEHYTVD